MCDPDYFPHQTGCNLNVVWMLVLVCVEDRVVSAVVHHRWRSCLSSAPTQHGFGALDSRGQPWRQLVLRPRLNAEAAFILTGLKLPLGPGLQGEAAAPPPGVLLGGDGIIHPGSS